jgi:hypothetical protein
MKERIYQFRDEVVAVTRGTATRVPFLYRMLGQRHTNLDLSQATADYSYAIWIKHLANLHETTGCGVPNVVAELGPGDTLGTGVAALLSGATRYIGIDKLPFARTGPTIEVANGLVPLFATRTSAGGRGRSAAISAFIGQEWLFVVGSNRRSPFRVPGTLARQGNP